MRKFATGLVLAMEEEDKRVEEAAAAEPAADSLETDLIEVTEDTAEHEEAEASVDEAVETTEALESYLVALESAAQQGGLDRHGAAMLNIGIGHMLGRLGIDSKKSTPAMESFGGISGRQGATQLAMEGIKEELARIWEAIKKAIKKSIDFVVGYFNKVFGSAEKLAKRAEALKKNIESNTAKAKESSFENEGLVKDLYIGTAVDGKKAAQVLKEVTGKVFGSWEKAYKKAEEIETALDKKPAEAKTALESLKLEDAYAGFLALEAPAEGVHKAVSDELPGGKAIVGQVPSTAADLGKFRLMLGAHDEAKKAPSSAKLTTLSKADISSIADIVAEISKELIANRKKADDAKKAKDKISKLADKLGKQEVEETDKDAAAAVQKVAGSFTKVVDSPYVSFSGYALTTAKRLLDYAELSIKQYAE